MKKTYHTSITPLLILITLTLSCNKKSTIQDPNPTIETTTTSPTDLRIYDSYADLESRFQTNSDSVYVVNFWATWCKPCVAELPHFMDLADTYQNKKVKFLYVSLDFKKQIDSKLRPFLEAGKLKGEVVVITDPDSNTWIDKVSNKWQGSIPATLVFTKDKRNFYEQSFTYKELEKVLKSHLK